MPNVMRCSVHLIISLLRFYVLKHFILKSIYFSIPDPLVKVLTLKGQKKRINVTWRRFRSFNGIYFQEYLGLAQ